MTYDVFSGTLNLTQSISSRVSHLEHSKYRKTIEQPRARSASATDTTGEVTVLQSNLVAGERGLAACG